MDFVSHALWGGIAFGRESKKYFLNAAGISIMPDILTEGLFFVLLLSGVGGMPGWETGHPNITDYPVFAQNLYNVTHSLVIFGAVLLSLSIFLKKTALIIAGWGLHILIDIPTHSLALFPTPFLWPISDFRVNGIGWDNPFILAVDIGLLIILYAVWLRAKFRRIQPLD